MHNKNTGCIVLQYKLKRQSSAHSACASCSARQLIQIVTGAHKGEARSILRAAATDTGKQIPSRRRTVSQILTVWQLDLCPDPSINKKLKLSLCKKKGKGELITQRILSVLHSLCCKSCVT